MEEGTFPLFSILVLLAGLIIKLTRGRLLGENNQIKLHMYRRGFHKNTGPRTNWALEAYMSP